MNQRSMTVIVVGDRFYGLAGQQEVRTVSALVMELRTGGFNPGNGRATLVFGQGVSEFDLELLRVEVARAELEDLVDFREPELKLAGRGQVHKRQESNVLIANLGKERDDLYTADLRIHNDNELLLDHQTGQHVQGMVVVEAARQMFLAVSERYFAGPINPGRDYYYVIESMKTEFKSFLFPLPATIEYTPIRTDIENANRMSFSSCIRVTQWGRLASETLVDFVAFESAVVKGFEGRRAAATVAAQISATTDGELVGV